MSSFKVISNRKLTDETFVLRTERPDVKILAGQCFSVGTKNLAINREYSMYSAADDPFVDFLIRKVEGGAVSTGLHELLVGDEVQIGGPYGQFCLNESLMFSKRYVFIASGTGIAPFHSFFQTYPKLNFELHHGVRHESETYDHSVYPEGTYRPYISRPSGNAMGRYVTSALQARQLGENEVFYLCGNRQMIIDCISILREKGIHGDSIFTETFF
jgi:ferredoxin-NADP reductase